MNSVQRVTKVHCFQVGRVWENSSFTTMFFLGGGDGVEIEMKKICWEVYVVEETVLKLTVNN
jgi:hypothetical protein